MHLEGCCQSEIVDIQEESRSCVRDKQSGSCLNREVSAAVYYDYYLVPMDGLQCVRLDHERGLKYFRNCSWIEREPVPAGLGRHWMGR
jgi:hypothetical protein